MLKLLSDVAVDGQVDSTRMERFLLRDFSAFTSPLQVLNPNENECSNSYGIQGSQEDLTLGIQPILYRTAAYLVVTGAPGSAELLHNVSTTLFFYYY